VAGPARLNCPTCQRPLIWNDDFPFRPFCSERCKLVDLGAWASGDRAIPGEPAQPDEPGGEQLPTASRHDVN